MDTQNIITIKIGSSILLTDKNALDESRIAQIASQVVQLHASDIQIVLIISGAVACGARLVEGMGENTALRQIAAGLGQAILTATFSRVFIQHDLHIAQILLTRKDLDCSVTTTRLISSIHQYLQRGFVPIINENDIIELNSFQGNDYLAAEITTLLDAERMIMLSSMRMSEFGVGGGGAKREVKKSLSDKGVLMQIVNGKEDNILLKTFL